MRIRWVGFVFAAALLSATDMPTGYFRGILLAVDGTPALGVLTARTPDGRVFECGYDAKSYLELDKRRITVSKLRDGDHVEILADRHPGQTTCYLRTLTVETYATQAPVQRPGQAKVVAAPQKPGPVRHGNKTFAGVVTRSDGGFVTLRTRNGEETFLLRRDTRYFGNGLKMDLADVTVNMRVSVEAATNGEGVLEAFQVTWGGISNVN